jgi:hypothetical protein
VNKVIAFYLPQYHPTKDNNRWWGEGFTEWTNVAKAKPLFFNHYQPKIPADLGFYDLRLPEVRARQAELAKEAGISGFCYYHYWFGNARQQLELPFNEVVSSGSPDFPFCLCWANETWSRKFWNKDGNVIGSETLIEQQYIGEEDDISHFNSLLPAFKDSRYMKIDGKLIFVIYRALAFNEINRFMQLWNALAYENGLNGFYFIAYSNNADFEYNKLKLLGFDSIISCRLNRNSKKKSLGWAVRKAFSLVFQTPRRISYKKVIKTLVTDFEKKEDVFPTILPNWDHTPRSGINGDLFTNSTPKLFGKHVSDVFNKIASKPVNRKYTFLKSWNEWGEGNYMEPDLKFGKQYIKVLGNLVGKQK